MDQLTLFDVIKFQNNNSQQFYAKHCVFSNFICTIRSKVLHEDLKKRLHTLALWLYVSDKRYNETKLTNTITLPDKNISYSEIDKWIYYTLKNMIVIKPSFIPCINKDEYLENPYDFVDAIIHIFGEKQKDNTYWFEMVKELRKYFI